MSDCISSEEWNLSSRKLYIRQTEFSHVEEFSIQILEKPRFISCDCTKYANTVVISLLLFLRDEIQDL